MQAFIGVKIVQAEEMTDEEYAGWYSNQLARIRCALPQWSADSGEEPRPGRRVRYPDGYVSWSPEATFVQAYLAVSDAEGSLLMNSEIPS